MKDIVAELRGYGDCVTSEAAAEIERLREALQRIDGINDNPAIYNPDIEAVLRAALDEQVAQ